MAKHPKNTRKLYARARPWRHQNPMSVRLSRNRYFWNPRIQIKRFANFGGSIFSGSRTGVENVQNFLGAKYFFSPGPPLWTIPGQSNAMLYEHIIRLLKALWVKNMIPDFQPETLEMSAYTTRYCRTLRFRELPKYIISDFHDIPPQFSHVSAL